MQPLSAPHSFFLRAAVGWLELGDTREARAELAQLPEDLRRHPDVLEVGWMIAAEDGNWAEALRLGSALVEVSPNRASGWLHWAYALRRAPVDGGLKQAYDALRPAFERFPKESTIPYNLACYACQMKDLEGARVWFKRAVAAGGRRKIRKMALADRDLEALWPEIQGLA